MTNLSVIISSNKSFDKIKNIINFTSKNNKVSEIIVIGPRIKNDLIFINNTSIHKKNSFKVPSKCIDIAINSITNKYFCSIPDDITFDVTNPFDQLFELKMKHKNKIFSTRYFINGENNTHELYLDNKFNLKDYYKNLIIPLCPIIDKDDFLKVKGIDHNIIHSYWDVDLILKILEVKKYEICFSYIALNEYKDSRPTLYSIYGQVDKYYFYKKWQNRISNKKYIFPKINLKKVLHKWKFNNYFLYNIMSLKIFEYFTFQYNKNLLRRFN